ncbi:MAG: flagellar biosynthesis protein FlhB [Ghiorsea sp.]|nr:flagellar biosynthesis protein FlhB [Ghiorsea sp.]PCI02888.1 MAG: flagellar biosynthesis protein FlhB [Zetaproteobacteria bacterium]
MSGEQDKSQQTEDASEKRLEDARKKGQVATSREPSTAISFLILASLSATGLGGWIALRNETLMKNYLSGQVKVDMTPEGMQTLLIDLSIDIALMVLPIAIPMVLVGMLIIYLVTGPVFTFETLKPKMEKVSPIKGFGRLFSSKSLAEFIKSVTKLSMISFICWYVVSDLFLPAIHSTRKGVDDIVMLMVDGSLAIVGLVAAFYFVIALADVIYQRWEHAKSMKMSMKEVRDEHKESEGDPQLKAKIRQIQMEQAQNRMMADVPKADVVITNPTHFAVALKYDTQGGGAPKVVAKGKDVIAQKIKALAKENGVPIRENKLLARSLFKDVQIGHEIPEQLFEAVAVILAEIFKVK